MAGQIQGTSSSSQGPIKERSTTKYSSPTRKSVRDKSEEKVISSTHSKSNSKKPDVLSISHPNLGTDTIEDSIKSEQFPVREQLQTDKIGDSRNLEDSSNSLSGLHPKMRRVKPTNVKGSNDMPEPRKSQLSKSKIKIEIEKLPNDDFDESYQNDEFENTVDS